MTTVLLCDDEEDLRYLLGRQLRRAGYEVTTVADGMAAVEEISRQSFDVIVSDMKMPRLDGMGLLARAKEMAPDTEFIILTGHGNMENAVLAFRTGNVFDYLLKPLDDIRELDAVVERAAERRRLRMENRTLTQELALHAENQRLLTELQAYVQELEETRRQLRELADRDGLTGLYNHRAIHRRLDSWLASGEQSPISVVLMDMDGFKQLNDAFGHPVGDSALRHLADALRAICGDSADIGRYGGDEFMIILPGCDSGQAAETSGHIRQHLTKAPFRNPEGSTIPLHLSFGIADSIELGNSALKIMTAADSALYAGKRSGGNTVTLYTPHEETEDHDDRQGFEVLDALVTAIDRKDQYTRLHSADMTRYALTLAHALGCSPATYSIVRIAGLLHDVGKIGIPDKILLKPGNLTADEREVMKKHVTLSALIIHGLPHLSDIQDAVAFHHERWDGDGYPRGLKGEEIPLLGRMMAIADAFSAMTLDRPYRVGMSREKALEEIECCAGSQFDPKLARIFVDAMRAGYEEDEELLAS